MATLRCDDLEATFVPDAGMVGCSLTHRGEELLHIGGGLERYRERGSSFGIPLLAPWANRLDTTIDAPAPPLKLDENGLPIHGVLAASPLWEVEEETEDRLVANLPFGAPDLLTAFPHPHALSLVIAIAPARVTIETTLRATGDVPVPVSFGWHPYLAPPGAPRREWSIEMPVAEHALLDDRGIPTGEMEAAGALDGSLAERSSDDMSPGVAPGAVFAVSGGGRRLSVEFGEGYPVAQVFSPPGGEFICFEPMTAPTNALVSGDGLRQVSPGETFTATFSIGVEDLGSGVQAGPLNA